MSYSKEQIRALAAQSHLFMTDDEAERYAVELDDMLAVADALKEIPEAVLCDSFLQARELSDLREDKTDDTPADKTLLLRACREDGYFSVPRAVEEQI